MRYFGRKLFFLFLTSFFLQSCLVQQAPERSLTSPGNNSTPNQTNTLGLWSRSPVQSAGYLVDAGDNLETLNRQSVVLYDLLSSNGNLSGSTVNVYYSPDDKNSPRLNAYGSSKIPWSNKDFQAYMVYAHTSGAYRYAQSLFPDIDFQVNGKNLFPIPAFAIVKGSPFETGYIINYSSSQLGALMFYGEDDPSFPYNTSDEADVIYHEVAHSFQHVLNPSVMETPGHYDMDMLLEALADFFAASALRDDKILLYLEANSPAYGSDRNGSNQIRRLDGGLSFPKSYVGEYHLDGRVIASALNDVRKYLTNQIVIVSQPTTKSLRWLASKPLTTSQAFDKVLVSSHEALRAMLPTSTILFFSQKFLDNLMQGDWSVYCGVDLSCVTRLRSDITSILVSRGIYKSPSDIRSKSFSVGFLDDLGINPSGAEIVFEKSLKFFPLSPSTGYSNVDASVDKCEALLVTPNFYLASGVVHSVYDTLFRLKSSLGFSTFRSIDLLSASSTISAKTLKLFGFILPGEDTFEAITSNRFYDDHQGSHLTSTSLGPENPSALGWATRTPAVLYPNDRSNTGRGAITYEMSFRPFEVLNAPNSVYSVLNITQSLYVSGTANFCSKN